MELARGDRCISVVASCDEAWLGLHVILSAVGNANSTASLIYTLGMLKRRRQTWKVIEGNEVEIVYLLYNMASCNGVKN